MNSTSTQAHERCTIPFRYVATFLEEKLSKHFDPTIAKKPCFYQPFLKCLDFITWFSATNIIVVEKPVFAVPCFTYCQFSAASANLSVKVICDDWCNRTILRQWYWLLEFILYLEPPILIISGLSRSGSKLKTLLCHDIYFSPTSQLILFWNYHCWYIFIIENSVFCAR